MPQPHGANNARRRQREILSVARASRPRLKMAQSFMTGIMIGKAHQSRQGRQNLSFVPVGTFHFHLRQPSLERLFQIRPMRLTAPFQSARGLAHSRTLRAVREPSANAPASWSAAALRRFSPERRRRGIFVENHSHFHQLRRSDIFPDDAAPTELVFSLMVFNYKYAAASRR